MPVLLAASTGPRRGWCHVVSASAGHANPTVTLNVYSHLLEGDQEKAAAVMDEALRAAIKDL
jgi:hypothetical protein